MNGRKTVLSSLFMAGIMIIVSSAPRKFEVFVASNRGISQPKLSYLVRQTAKPPAAYHNNDKVRSKIRIRQKTKQANEPRNSRIHQRMSLRQPAFPRHSGVAFNGKGMIMEGKPWNKRIEQFKPKTVDFSGDTFLSTISNRITRSSNSRGDSPRLFKNIRGFRDIVPPNNQLQRPRDISSYWPDIANDKLQPIVDNGGLYQEEDFRVFRGNGNVFLPPQSTTLSTTLGSTKHPIQTTASKTDGETITTDVRNMHDLTTEHPSGKHEIETFSNSAESQHRLPVHYNVVNPSTESLPDVRSQKLIIQNKTRDPEDLVVSFVKENTSISHKNSVEENTLPENIKKEADLRSTIDESLKGLSKKKKQRVYLMIHKFPHNTTHAFLGKSTTRSRRKTILNYDNLYKHFSKLTKPIPLSDLFVDSDGFDGVPNLGQQNISLVNNVTSSNLSTVLGDGNNLTNITTTIFPLFSHSTSGSTPLPNTTQFLLSESPKMDEKDGIQTKEAYNNITEQNVRTLRTNEASPPNREDVGAPTSDLEESLNILESAIRSTTSNALERKTKPGYIKTDVRNNTEQKVSAQTKKQDTVEQFSINSTLGSVRNNSIKATIKTSRLVPTTKTSIISATNVSTIKEVVINDTKTDEFVQHTIAPIVNITEQAAFIKTENAVDKTGSRESNSTFLLSDVTDVEISIQTRQVTEDTDLKRSNVSNDKLGSRNDPKQTAHFGNDTLAEGSILDLEEMSDYIEEFVHVKNASKVKNHFNHFASLNERHDKKEKTNMTQDVVKNEDFLIGNNSFLKDTIEMFDDDLNAVGSKTVTRKGISNSSNYGIGKPRLEKAIAPLNDIPLSSNSDYYSKERQIIHNITKPNSTTEGLLVPAVPQNSTVSNDLRVTSVDDAMKKSSMNTNDSVLTRQEKKTNEKNDLPTFVSVPLKSSPFDVKSIEQEPRTTVNITKHNQPHNESVVTSGRPKNISKDVKKTAKNSTKPMTRDKKLKLAMSLDTSIRKTKTSLDIRKGTNTRAKINRDDKVKKQMIKIIKDVRRSNTNKSGNILTKLNLRETHDYISDRPKASKKNKTNGEKNLTIIEPSDNKDTKANILQNSISTKNAEKRKVKSEQIRIAKESDMNLNKTVFTNGGKVKYVKQNETNKSSKSSHKHGKETPKGSVEMKSTMEDYIQKNDKKERVQKNKKVSKIMKEKKIPNDGKSSKTISVPSNFSEEKKKKVNTIVTKVSENVTNKNFTPKRTTNPSHGNRKSVIDTNRTKRKNRLKYLKTVTSKNESKRIKHKNDTDIDRDMEKKLKSIENQRKNRTKLLDNFVEMKMNKKMQLPKKKNKTPLEMLSRDSKDNSSIATDKIRALSQKKSLQSYPRESFPKNIDTLPDSKNKTQQSLFSPRNKVKLKPEQKVTAILQNSKSTFPTNTTRADLMVTDSKNAFTKDNSNISTTALSNITNNVELHGKKNQLTISNHTNNVDSHGKKKQLIFPIAENKRSKNDTIAVDAVMPEINPGSSSNTTVKLQDKQNPTTVIFEKKNLSTENKTSISMEITTKTDNLIETKTQILRIRNTSLSVDIPQITTLLSNTTSETTTLSLFETTRNHLITPEVDLQLSANFPGEKFKDEALNVEVNETTHYRDLSTTKENDQTNDLQLPTHNASKVFKDTALNIKVNKMPRQSEPSVSKDTYQTMSSFHVPLSLLSTTLPTINTGTVEVKSLLNTKEPKTVSNDLQHSKKIFHDKEDKKMTKLPTLDTPTDLISPTVKPFRKSDVNDTSAELEKASKTTELNSMPPRPIIPSTNNSNEKIIQFIGKASDLVKKMNGKNPEFLDLLTETDMNHFSGNTLQPVFQNSNVKIQSSSNINELEKKHGIDKDLGKGQSISEIFKHDENNVERKIKSSAFYSELKNGHNEQNIFNTHSFDKNKEDRKFKDDQPFVEWITRRNNGKLKGIQPGVYTTTNKTFNENERSLSNNSIPDILKSNLGPKSYNKLNMPLMNTLMSLRQKPTSGLCNSTLGKEEIMSLAVNVLRLLVSNLKLQQALQRSHEHIVSTHFQSRRYMLIPLPEGNRNRNKTILLQRGYQKVSQPNLSSANSLQRQMQTFLSRNALNENLAISPLIKRRSLRKGKNNTFAGAQEDKSIEKENQLFAMKQKSPIFNKAVLTATTKDNDIQGKHTLMEKESDLKVVTENSKRNQRVLLKTRIKFHPSS